MGQYPIFSCLAIRRRCRCAFRLANFLCPTLRSWVGMSFLLFVFPEPARQLLAKLTAGQDLLNTSGINQVRRCAGIVQATEQPGAGEPVKESPDENACLRFH